MVRDSSKPASVVLPSLVYSRWASCVAAAAETAIRDFWYRTQTLTGDRVISAAIVSDKKYLTYTCSMYASILEKLHHHHPIEAIRNFWFSPHDHSQLQQVVTDVEWSSFETLIVWQWQDARGGVASYYSVKFQPIFDNALTVFLQVVWD